MWYIVFVVCWVGIRGSSYDFIVSIAISIFYNRMSNIVMIGFFSEFCWISSIQRLIGFCQLAHWPCVTFCCWLFARFVLSSILSTLFFWMNLFIALNRHIRELASIHAAFRLMFMRFYAFCNRWILWVCFVWTSNCETYLKQKERIDYRMEICDFSSSPKPLSNLTSKRRLDDSFNELALWFDGTITQ